MSEEVATAAALMELSQATEPVSQPNDVWTGEQFVNRSNLQSPRPKKIEVKPIYSVGSRKWGDYIDLTKPFENESQKLDVHSEQLDPRRIRSLPGPGSDLLGDWEGDGGESNSTPARVRKIQKIVPNAPIKASNFGESSLGTSSNPRRSKLLHERGRLRNRRSSQTGEENGSGGSDHDSEGELYELRVRPRTPPPMLRQVSQWAESSHNPDPKPSGVKTRSGLVLRGNRSGQN